MAVHPGFRRNSQPRLSLTARMLPTARRLSLILPPLVPAAIVLAFFGAELVSHDWSVHGDLLGMIFLLLASIVVGGVVEIRALTNG